MTKRMLPEKLSAHPLLLPGETKHVHEKRLQFEVTTLNMLKAVAF